MGLLPIYVCILYPSGTCDCALQQFSRGYTLCPPSFPSCIYPSFHSLLPFPLLVSILPSVPSFPFPSQYLSFLPFSPSLSPALLSILLPFLPFLPRFPFSSTFLLSLPSFPFPHFYYSFLLFPPSLLPFPFSIYPSLLPFPLLLPPLPPFIFPTPSFSPFHPLSLLHLPSFIPFLFHVSFSLSHFSSFSYTFYSLLP